MLEVEVFQTNVPNRRTALGLLRCLQAAFPACRITFDLDDCDRILRIEGPPGSSIPVAVEALLQAQGFQCAVLLD